MPKVLLRCLSAEDAKLIQNYLETDLHYQITLARSAKEVLSHLRNRTFQLLVLQTGNLAKEDIGYASQIRGLNYVYPILMITDSVGNLSVSDIHDKLNVTFLERPFEFKKLKGLVRKLMVKRTIPQQVFRRYRTNVMATLETFIGGEQYHSHMFNLSRGGAYFEMSNKPGVAVGDLLRLSVNLLDMERSHQVHARVVWTTHKGHAAGGYGLGIKFMKGADIYRNLMESV